MSIENIEYGLLLFVPLNRGIYASDNLAKMGQFYSQNGLRMGLTARSTTFSLHLLTQNDLSDKGALWFVARDDKARESLGAPRQ